MKFVHISDLHIRNYKYHSSYKKVFDNFQTELKNIKPDLVVNTGDTAHSKNNISPEFVSLCSYHLKKISDICPYHLIYGNHDLNLTNLNRIDALSPIINNINSNNIYLYEKSGIYYLNNKFRFFVFSCVDKENYPLNVDKNDLNNHINIGLYHGAILNSTTDTGWIIDDYDEKISTFNGLDFVFLGDIHKHQFLGDNRRIAYAGSLIQQNFGEDTNKGFLLWNIKNKNEWTVEHIHVPGSRKFYTVNIDINGNIENKEQVEKDSFLRIESKKTLTSVDVKNLKQKIRELYRPRDIISVIQPVFQNNQDIEKIIGNISVSSFSEENIQKFFLKDFLQKHNFSQDVIDEAIKINKNITVEKDLDFKKHKSWKLNSIFWDNMFIYGEGNYINFDSLKGVIGIFGKNSLGKSSIIEIICHSLFDRISKTATKNINIINDNKNYSIAIVNFSIPNVGNFLIERKIEKINDRGVTKLKFYQLFNNGLKKELNGQTRSETEFNIRNTIGDFEDFSLTSLLSQQRNDILDFKTTQRKKLFYKFFNLDVFEKKYEIAKNDFKPIKNNIKNLFDENLTNSINELENELFCLNKMLSNYTLQKKFILEEIENQNNELMRKYEKKEKVPETIDILHIKTRLDRIKNNFFENKNKIIEFIDLSNKLKKEIENLNKFNVVSNLEKQKEQKEKINTIKIEVEKNNRVLQKKINKIKINQKNILILDDVPCGNKFPECKFLKNAFEGKKEIECLKKDIVVLNDILKQKNKELNYETDNIDENFIKSVKTNERLQIVKTKSLDVNLAIANLKFKQEKLFSDALVCETKKQEYFNFKDRILNNKKINKEIVELEKIKKLKQKELNEIQDKILKINKNIFSKETVLQEHREKEKKINKLKLQYDSYEAYLLAFGKNGILNNLINKLLPLVNKEINNVLSQVVNFSVFIENDNDGFNFYIKNKKDNKRLLELAGEAQKFISTIAVRIALLNITNAQKPNLFIIDEGFGSLDLENIESIYNMFNILRKEFEHTLIISHSDVIKDFVDETIEIQNSGKYSKVEVV